MCHSCVGSILEGRPNNGRRWLTEICRERLAKNVSVWLQLRRVLEVAIDHLEEHSLPAEEDQPLPLPAHEISESATLILKHFDVLKDDLHYVNSLLVISRNMLAVKETAQEICFAVQLHTLVKSLMELCVNVTIKGYDGENAEGSDRAKLLEITELCGSLFPLQVYLY